MVPVYKICATAEWQAARENGFYDGSIADRGDGFIHLSTAAQVRETAKRHFAGQSGLVLITFNADELAPALAWEPSRDGQLFPHFYGRLPAERALSVSPLPLDATGHRFPAEIPE